MTMEFLDALAEERILAAQARGEFDHLPGAGRPLDLDDDPFIPPELRMAYRILKNAGFVPPEVEARRELGQLAALIADSPDAEERIRALKRLELLKLHLATSRYGAGLAGVGQYHERVLARLAESCHWPVRGEGTTARG